MSRLSEIIAPLFAPGHRPDRFEKAAASGADAVIIDLEDAVAPEDKDAARAALRSDFTDLPVLVRVNGAGTPWHAADVAAVAQGGFDGVILPKAELREALASLAAGDDGPPVLALIETARGLAEARAIAALPGVARLVFGSIDYAADLGCAHVREALLGARIELVFAARLAAKPAPIDGVTARIDDLEEAESDALYARDLGFGGKLCIHPRQIAPVLAGFRPDDAEIAWARKVLASGDGATAVDGEMIDAPVRARARRILRAIGELADG